MPSLETRMMTFMRQVGHLSGTKKNPLYIAASMSAAWDADIKFPVLSKVIDTVLKMKPSASHKNMD